MVETGVNQNRMSPPVLPVVGATVRASGWSRSSSHFFLEPGKSVFPFFGKDVWALSLTRVPDQSPEVNFSFVSAPAGGLSCGGRATPGAA
jgi:hypothetical protein